jgi:AsmA family protein
MNQSTARPVRWRLAIAGVAAAFVVAFGICEALGWPFLAAPMQRWLGQTLQRRVSLGPDSNAPDVRIHLLGGIRLASPLIEIGAPNWSSAPHTIRAENARMTLGYFDLWHASRGQPLRVRELRATSLDARIERLADGRASWQFGTKTDTPDTQAKPVEVPLFGRLQVDKGTLVYRDALLAAQLDATYSLVEGSEPTSVAVAAPGASGVPAGLQFSGTGSYRKQPIKVELSTIGVLPVVAEDSATRALPVSLDARVGGASVSFKGTATDVTQLTALKGRFTIKGPSLAAAGEPVGVTLPTTGPFRAEGLIAKDGLVWNAVFENAAIGASRLGGAFTYDPRPSRPLLSGRLTGSKLLLADLGPAVGAPAQKTASTPEVALEASNPRRASSRAGRVLPDREFDLPSLRAMDANVLVAIDNLDLGTSFLEPLKPLRTHLVLTDGVLSLRELDARTAQGRLFGNVQLDGRNAVALWAADLRWAGVRLENWIHQKRGADAPPYVTGRLNGQARVQGQGKSTAAILGSLGGGLRTQLVNGTVSHLAIEAAGLDIAQGLGMLVKGDDALKVQCTVADFAVAQGVLKPRVFVLDTADSTLLIDGSVSLASESLDLRVTTAPKDFSPLALRTPVRVRGSFADPSVSLEAGRLAGRVGAAALLSFINPLAALLPFIDLGDGEDASRGSESCKALSQRIAAKPSLPAPAAAPQKPARRPA